MAQSEYLCPHFTVRYVDGQLTSPVNTTVTVRGRQFPQRAATIALMHCPVPPEECPINFEDRIAEGRIELNATQTAVLHTAETNSLLNAKAGAEKFMLAKCPRIDRQRGRYRAPSFDR